jgi:hypothetical protein
MPDPSGTSKRWNVQSEVYPACSARIAKRVMFSGVDHAPETGKPNPTLMGPP